MIRQALSELSASRPADWGFKVSICLAVRYSTPKFDHHDRLILITDSRVAFGDFSGELALKSSALWHGWSVMFAGDEVEHAEPILRNAKASMIALAKRLGRGRIITPEEAVGIVDSAYAEQLQAQIENKILRKRGFDSESFFKQGKIKCTPEVYAKLGERIDKEKLSLRFLVCGIDQEGKAHIWGVDGENAPKSYNAIGFWAIGSGAPLALGRLSVYLSKYKGFSSLEEAVYVAVTAKFSAESASNVGPSTNVFVEKHQWEADESIFLTPQIVERLREAWIKTGVPPVPKAILRGLKIYLPVMAHYVTKDIDHIAKQKEKARKSIAPKATPSAFQKSAGQQ